MHNQQIDAISRSVPVVVTSTDSESSLPTVSEYWNQVMTLSNWCLTSVNGDGGIETSLALFSRAFSAQLRLLSRVDLDEISRFNSALLRKLAQTTEALSMLANISYKGSLSFQNMSRRLSCLRLDSVVSKLCSLKMSTCFVILYSHSLKSSFHFVSSLIPSIPPLPSNFLPPPLLPLHNVPFFLSKSPPPPLPPPDCIPPPPPAKSSRGPHLGHVVYTATKVQAAVPFPGKSKAPPPPPFPLKKGGPPLPGTFRSPSIHVDSFPTPPPIQSENFQEIKKIHLAILPQQRFSKSLFSSLIRKDLEIDYSVLLKHFARPKGSGVSSQGIFSNSVTNQPVTSYVLSKNKSQAVEIFLNAKGQAKVRNVISKIEISEKPETLEEQEIFQQLVSIYPSKEESDTLINFRSSLGKAEKFLLDIVSIEKFKERTQNILRMSLLPEEVLSVKSQLVDVQRCWKSLKESKTLKDLFLIISLCANYLNQASSRNISLARGFCLDSLAGLKRVDSFHEKNFNFLRFVFECLDRNICWKSLNEELLLCSEISQKIDIDESIKKANEVVQDFNQLGAEALEFTGRMREQFMCFSAIWASEVKSLQEISEAVKNQTLEMVDFFGEKQTTPQNEIFSILSKFRLDLIEAKKDSILSQNREKRKKLKS